MAFGIASIAFLKWRKASSEELVIKKLIYRHFWIAIVGLRTTEGRLYSPIDSLTCQGSPDNHKRTHLVRG